MFLIKYNDNKMLNRIFIKIIIAFCCIIKRIKRQRKQEQERQTKIAKQQAENALAIKRLVAIKNRAKKEQQSL